MQIEQAVSYIEDLLHEEPWREEVGESTGKLCTGGVDKLSFDGSKYWHCLRCGRIGRSASPLHAPPPKSLLNITPEQLNALFR